VLTENRAVKQEQGGRRRWFEDDGLELIVWYRAPGEMEGFQLCYDQSDGMHALTWRQGAGFAHHRVDPGDTSPLKNETPVLAPHGRARCAEATALFRARSAGLEAPLRELILKELEAGP
jgi:hypothetical protein